MRLIKNQAGQGVGGVTVAAAVGYVVVKSSSGTVVGAGAVTAIGTTGVFITLTAADVSHDGPLAILPIDAGNNVVGQISADVGNVALAAAMAVACLSVAATGYQVIRPDGSNNAGLGTTNAVGGVVNGFFFVLAAGDIVGDGPYSILPTNAGAAVVGQINTDSYTPAVVTAGVTYTVTVIANGVTVATATMTSAALADLRNAFKQSRLDTAIQINVTQTNIASITLTPAVLPAASLIRLLGPDF